MITMKKEFVVKSIDSAPDGAPYVVLSLSSLKDLKEGNQNPPSPFGSPKVMGFSNMNDMMKDLNKMMSGAGGMGMQSGIKSNFRCRIVNFQFSGISKFWQITFLSFFKTINNLQRRS